MPEHFSVNYEYTRSKAHGRPVHDPNWHIDALIGYHSPSSPHNPPEKTAIAQEQTIPAPTLLNFSPYTLLMQKNLFWKLAKILHSFWDSLMNSK
jgi:hypothetical protein